MRDRTEVAKTIDEILIPYVDCIAWKDFGAAGSPCYDPNDFSSSGEEEEAAYTLAAVQLEMEKYGTRHTNLAAKVAEQTGDKYVTYPWLRDAVSRILSGTTYDELLPMFQLSRAVKAGMQAKGLKEIHSIAEALS
mgnify:CR=1 FL=1